MLHKCANASCANLFLRLNEGKLFQIETEYFDNLERGNTNGGSRPKSRRRVEYFWLCSECAPFLSLSFDKGHGVITVPLADGRGTKTVSAMTYKGFGAKANTSAASCAAERLVR